MCLLKPETKNNYNTVLSPAIEADSLASLVSQRLDLELLMREILALEQRLSQLTPDSPDYTDGKLTPITLAELQTRVPFINWEDFLVRGFKIVNHDLDPGLTIMIDQGYLMVRKFDLKVFL